ncbi:hypothetical protein Trydic_g17292 [Trypoxylus dichotomus]
MIVWEYVADFSNMKRLNPTIIDFTILDESGNYDHWKYSVMYSEHLSHWPYLENHAVAHFGVKADEKNNVFHIESTHRTCLFNGNFCVNSKSTFKFIKESTQDTRCQEEVEFQRTAIMKNLQRRFNK